MIGSTDAHTSLATAAEDNFWGKAVGVEPGRPRTNMVFLASAKDPSLDIMAWQQVAAGYAAVWAKENSRAAIFDAMTPQGGLCLHRPADAGPLLRRLELFARRTSRAPMPSPSATRAASRWAATCCRGRAATARRAFS